MCCAGVTVLVCVQCVLMWQFWYGCAHDRGHERATECGVLSRRAVKWARTWS